MIRKLLIEDFFAQSGASIPRAIWKWSGETCFPGTFITFIENIRHYDFCLVRFAPNYCPWFSEVDVIKAVTAFLTVHYLACATIANITKRFLCKIESHERLTNCWYVNTFVARVKVTPRLSSLKEKSLVVSPSLLK